MTLNQSELALLLQKLDQIDGRCERIETKLDGKADADDMEDVELRLRTCEQTDTRHETIGKAVAAVWTAALAILGIYVSAK